MMSILRTLAIAALLALAACATQKAGSDEASRDTNLEDVHAHCYGYIYGLNGFPKDYARAFEWCKRGAEAGIPSSQTLFAELYLYGEYVTKDYAVAEHWYLLAAKQGHVHAQYMMARLELAKANPDIDTACYWLTMSSFFGYDKAEKMLKELEDGWKKQNPEATKAFCDRNFDHVDKS